MKSNRAAANAAKTSHAFRLGVGYLNVGPLQAPKARIGKGNECDPPKGTADGSRHLLKAPSGGEQLPFTWVARESAWERFGGRRMAFPASYLAQHGWTYVGPVT